MAKKKLKVEYLPLDELRHHKKNAKLHHDEAMMNSIMRFDFADPVLYNQHPDANFIVAGHGRCTALARLRDERGDPPENISVDAKGRWLVPVVKLSLPPGEAEAFLLAHNKIGEVGDPDLGAWDMDLLSAVVGDMQLLDTNLEGLGWDAGELDEIALGGVLKGPPGSGGGDDPPPNKADELQEKWGTELGQMWKCGEHRIICGDCTDQAVVDLVMGGEKAALCVTSPPYNQKINKFAPSGMHKEHGWVSKVASMAYADDMPEEDYQLWQSKLLQQWNDIVIADNGSVFYNHKIRYRDKEAVSPMRWLPGPFRLRQEIVWSRPGSVTQNARMFLPSDERIYWLYKGDNFTFNDTTEIKSWSTVWAINPGGDSMHAVAYPGELPRRCIIACSSVNSVVYDPFLGSGTTMIACERLNRRCRGIELSPAYVAVCLERWHLETGLDPELLT